MDSHYWQRPSTKTTQKERLKKMNHTKYRPSKVDVFAGFIRQVILKLQDRKTFTFDGSKDSTANIMNSIDYLEMEIRKVDPTLWKNPELIATTIMYTMADYELREEYAEEMRQTIWIQEAVDDTSKQTGPRQAEYHRKGVMLVNGKLKVEYPCVDVICKVLDAREKMEARHRTYRRWRTQ